MPSAFRGRTVWVIPLLLFLAILLVAGLAFNLAHLDTGGEQLPATPGSGSPIANPQGLLDPDTAAVLLVATFIAFVVSAIVLVFLKKKGPRVKRIVRPIGWADVLATLIAFVVFAGLIYLYPHLVSSVNPQAGGSNGTAGGAGDTTLIPAVGGNPLGAFLAAALAADYAIERLKRVAWRRPVYGALVLYGAYHVGVMAMLHPDEYVYYNLLVGGLPGARGRR